MTTEYEAPGTDLDAIATAVFLLVSGLDEAGRNDLVRRVFGTEYVTIAQYQRLTHAADRIKDRLRLGADIADGTSGLGLIAAQSISQVLREALEESGTITDIIKYGKQI